MKNLLKISFFIVILSAVAFAAETLKFDVFPRDEILVKCDSGYYMTFYVQEVCQDRLSVRLYDSTTGISRWFSSEWINTHAVRIKRITIK